MKRRRHTPEQIIRKLAEGERLLEQGKPIEEVVRHLEVTEATWYRWRNQYGGMKADDAKRLKALERENAPAEEDRGRPGPGYRHVAGSRPLETFDPGPSPAVVTSTTVTPTSTAPPPTVAPTTTVPPITAPATTAAPTTTRTVPTTSPPTTVHVAPATVAPTLPPTTPPTTAVTCHPLTNEGNCY